MAYIKSWLKRRPRRPFKRRRPSSVAFYRPGGIIGYKRHVFPRLIALSCLTSSSTIDIAPSMDHGYDSDSFKIRIDNCCTASITNSLKDVVGHPVPIRAYVKGFGGNPTPVTHKVTIRWCIEDDQGRRHYIELPNSYYSPTGEKLLCPQQWSQIAKDNYPTPDGTCCLTTGSSIKLFWNQRKYCKTVPLDPKSNVGVMRSAPGYDHFKSFCSEVSEFDSEVACMSHLILDDDPSVNPPTHVPTASGVQTSSLAPTTTLELTHDQARAHMIPIDEDQSEIQREIPRQSPTEIKVSTEVIDLDQGAALNTPSEPNITDAETLLLRWHVRLGHLSFSRLKILALQGILPKKLIGCESPICLACKYGKATRRPWRTKAEPNRIQPIKITKPGQCVSVDQMQSSTPGFVAQMKGQLTRLRYTGATIFVDHFSRLCYVHPQKSLSAEETLQAKHEFEAFAASHNVKVKHYHADNGRFAENAWINDLSNKGQTISYCGVEAHHQNGIAEKTIRDLQDQARTMILHAKHRWPSVITHHLWPYALRLANTIRNNTPREFGTPSPLELFTESPVRANLEHFHTFGCPVFAFEPNTSKWEERARLGLYLGPSPKHAKNVALVLNLSTGLVSPQFHVSYDEHFHTVKDAPHSITSRWTFLAGLSGQNESLSSAPEPLVPQGTTISMVTEDSKLSDASTAAPNTSSSSSSAENTNPELSLALECLVLPSCCLEEDSSHANPLAYVARRDPDTLYYQEALRAPDRKQFLKAMKDEIRQHEENGHWKMILRSKIPPDTKVLPAIWAMKRKRRISTREVYKWKARLNVHGGKQEYGTHYTDTYSPVIGWSSIRLFLILSILHGWHTRQLDFVLAYPQADIEKPLYMELPPGINFKIDRKQYVLKLLKNLYGQKQAGRVWHKHLINGLLKLGFQQSKFDECLLYRDGLAVLIYVDDTIICCKDKDKIDNFVTELGSKFKVQEVGDIQDFLGVQVTKSSEGAYILKQPHLIDSILDELGFHKDPQHQPKEKDVPAMTTAILDKDEDGIDFNEKWDYRRIIGKLNFLEKSTRPDLAYAVHQCARFQSCPKTSHAKAIKRIARYLLSTRDKGLIIKPRDSLLECYADADFAGNWNRTTAESDASTAHSRTGFTILYAGCPLTWASRLQTEIALSTTEAEYIALSTALRDVIPIMNLLQELKEQNFINDFQLPKIHCKAFEDNSGALELARTPKMRPRTKHINIKYHHFRSYVDEGLISIHKINTNDQIADIFTKPLSYPLFTKHRKTLLGW